MNLKQLLERHTLRCIGGGFVLALIVVAGGMLMDKASASPAFCDARRVLAPKDCLCGVSSAARQRRRLLL